MKKNVYKNKITDSASDTSDGITGVLVFERVFFIFFFVLRLKFWSFILTLNDNYISMNVIYNNFVLLTLFSVNVLLLNSLFFGKLIADTNYTYKKFDVNKQFFKTINWRSVKNDVK